MMEKYIDIVLPIKTISESNCTEHWSKKHKRHKLQKQLVWLEFKKIDVKFILPCHVKITRISPRKLDYDNLCSSQKYLYDALCDLIIPGLKPGRADGDPRITVEYHQSKGKPKEYSVRIEIFYL